MSVPILVYEREVFNIDPEEMEEIFEQMSNQDLKLLFIQYKCNNTITLERVKSLFIIVY